jgi:ribosomal protein S18 acetylase RimI-like enzyme
LITLRRAEAADVPALRRLLQALADHDHGPQVASEVALLEHGFGPRPLFHAALAEQDGAALGMVIYYPDYSTHRGEPGLYVQDIYVAPAARGTGLGTRLLAAAMRLQDWGARYLTLGVDPGNADARAFYAARGFRPRGYDFLILDGTALEALKE